MILLVTAIHAEAKPFIKSLSLKKDTSVRSHEIFRNEEYELIVSGIGKINSAIATTLLLNRHRDKNIVIGNIGVAGAAHLEVGTLCLIHKVMDSATKTSYYPEQLLNTPLAESMLSTFDAPVTDPKLLIDTESLVDMEASGFANAASYFVDPSRYFILKCVSDNLSCSELTLEKIESIIESRSLDIMMYARSLLALIVDNVEDIFSSQEEQTTQHVFRHLSLTESQQRLISDDLRGYKIKHGNIMGVLTPISKIKIESTEAKNKIYNDTRQLLRSS